MLRENDANAVPSVLRSEDLFDICGYVDHFLARG
jgi:hypothetical protein